MKFQFDSYCGLYCGACFILNAYTQNRTDCLPKEWVSPLDGKKMKCHGCKSKLVFENCRRCQIRKCAQSKDVKYCNTCPSFPCEKIKRIEDLNLPHHQVALHNMEQIKEIGLSKWLKRQKKRWLCPNCGNPFSWYEENCTQCGKELFNSVEEMKTLNRYP